MDQTSPGKRPNSNKTDNAMDTAGGAGTARTVDDVAASAHRTVDRAASSAQPAVDRLAANAHGVVDRVSEKATGAAETIESRYDDFQSTRERLGDQCRSYVEDNPLKAVGIALAAGFILSRLI